MARQAFRRGTANLGREASVHGRGGGLGGPHLGRRAKPQARTCAWPPSVGGAISAGAGGGPRKLTGRLVAMVSVGYETASRSTRWPRPRCSSRPAPEHAGGGVDGLWRLAWLGSTPVGRPRRRLDRPGRRGTVVPGGGRAWPPWACGIVACRCCAGSNTPPRLAKSLDASDLAGPIWRTERSSRAGQSSRNEGMVLRKISTQLAGVPSRNSNSPNITITPSVDSGHVRVAFKPPGSPQRLSRPHTLGRADPGARPRRGRTGERGPAC